MLSGLVHQQIILRRARASTDLNASRPPGLVQPKYVITLLLGASTHITAFDSCINKCCCFLAASLGATTCLNDFWLGAAKDVIALLRCLRRLSLAGSLMMLLRPSLASNKWIASLLSGLVKQQRFLPSGFVYQTNVLRWSRTSTNKYCVLP